MEYFTKDNIKKIIWNVFSLGGCPILGFFFGVLAIVALFSSFYAMCEGRIIFGIVTIIGAVLSGMAAYLFAALFLKEMDKLL